MRGSAAYLLRFATSTGRIFALFSVTSTSMRIIRPAHLNRSFPTTTSNPPHAAQQHHAPDRRCYNPRRLAALPSSHCRLPPCSRTGGGLTTSQTQSKSHTNQSPRNSARANTNSSRNGIAWICCGGRWETVHGRQNTQYQEVWVRTDRVVCVLVAADGRNRVEARRRCWFRDGCKRLCFISSFKIRLHY